MKITEWKSGPVKIYKIQQALMELGATKYEVYARYQKLRRGQRRLSLQNRYTYEEFKEWIRELYIQAVKDYHPDYHPSLTDVYQEKMVRVNAAREWALGWLEANKHRMKQY